MKRKHLVPVLAISVLLLSGTISCAQQPGEYPEVWIDYPADGAVIQSGQTVTVMSHIFARGGVAEVVLSVNGEAYRHDVPAEAGQEFIALQQDWSPGETGIYTLQVQAYDTQGVAGNPALVTIEINGEENAPPTSTFTPTPSISITPEIATPTFTPHPPTPTLTPTPHPPTPAPDTTAPPVPTPIVPANGLELTCRSTQTLAWTPVNDASGITGYYIKLEREVSAGNWQSISGYGPLNDKQVNASVQCGLRYRWAVRAQDGAGNMSDWSAFSVFSVALN